LVLIYDAGGTRIMTKVEMIYAKKHAMTRGYQAPLEDY
jgi:hypothetical protein